MVAALLSVLLAGGIINLLVDGLKQWLAAYDRSKPLWKHVLVWGSALGFVVLIRGFDLPDSGLGWVWFFVTTVVIALVAYGLHRLRQVTVSRPLIEELVPDVSTPASPSYSEHLAARSHKHPPSGPLT